jgi:hypothetical protein
MSDSWTAVFLSPFRKTIPSKRDTEEDETAVLDLASTSLLEEIKFSEDNASLEETTLFPDISLDDSLNVSLLEEIATKASFIATESSLHATRQSAKTLEQKIFLEKRIFLPFFVLNLQKKTRNTTSFHKINGIKNKRSCSKYISQL